VSDFLYGPLSSPRQLGQTSRGVRKEQQLTLEQLSGASGLGMRFVSEFERGKTTAELGKALEALEALGLDVYLAPRSMRARIAHLNAGDSDD
jgi:transcriptional regulator with XRE-family HTH domain